MGQAVDVGGRVLRVRRPLGVVDPGLVTNPVSAVDGLNDRHGRFVEMNVGVITGAPKDLPLTAHPATRALFARPQWAQRTPEWYAKRRELLTASDVASALGIAPYKSFRGDPRAECMQKKLDNAPLFGMAMVHGVRYEDEARDAAMSALGEKSHDFGLLVHPRHPWLAASPDGVTESGKAVEIKAPLKRTIVPGQVPAHYLPQVQVQMEVCDLDQTIFVQYKPGFLSPDGKPIVDIVVVERDRRWFAEHVGTMRAFWEEYMARRVHHVPAVCAPLTCLVDEDLYSSPNDQNDQNDPGPPPKRQRLS